MKKAPGAVWIAEFDESLPAIIAAENSDSESMGLESHDFAMGTIVTLNSAEGEFDAADGSWYVRDDTTGRESWVFEDCMEQPSSTVTDEDVEAAIASITKAATQATTPRGYVNPLHEEMIRRAKEEAWDECFDWCEDMFAMPATNHNPYRSP